MVEPEAVHTIVDERRGDLPEAAARLVEVANQNGGRDNISVILLRVPAVRRDHSHDLLDEETGEPSTEERWRFTRLGDAQLLARYQATIGEGATSLAAFGGLKLPTGSIHVANDDDVRAERALQPGTGTNDLVVGLAGRSARPTPPSARSP